MVAQALPPRRTAVLGAAAPGELATLRVQGSGSRAAGGGVMARSAAARIVAT